LKISWLLNLASRDGYKAEKRAQKEVWHISLVIDSSLYYFQPKFSMKTFSIFQSPYFAALGAYISILHKVAGSLWPLP
jgi:hypothetical protein